jgi:hypothetical protein
LTFLTNLGFSVNIRGSVESILIISTEMLKGRRNNENSTVLWSRDPLLGKYLETNNETVAVAINGAENKPLQQ